MTGSFHINAVYMESIYTKLCKGLSASFRFRLGLLLLILSFSVIELYAEGSRDLYPSGAQGYRAYLMARPYATGSGAVAAFDPYRNPGVVRVYAQTGETIYAGSSIVGKRLNTQGLPGNIIVISPSGQRYSIYTENSTSVSITQIDHNNPNSTRMGLIRNRSEEKNGPRLSVGDGGYHPYTVAVNETGIWEVQFIAPGTSTNLPTPAAGPHPAITYDGISYTTSFDARFLADNDWIQPLTYGGNTSNNASLQMALIAAWDVTVRGNNEWKKGRVYSNVVNLTGPNTIFSTPTLFTKFIVLTKSGYSYTVETNGMNGASFNFFSNNKGVRVNSSATSAPAYLGLGYSSNTDYESNIAPRIWDPRITDDVSSNNHTNKIFYNRPDSSMPASTVAYYSDPNIVSPAVGGSPNLSVWLLPERTPPLISNLRVHCGGLIRFHSNVRGTYRILIDVNSNGNFDENVDRVIYGQAEIGENEYLWDRRNGQGTLLATNTNVNLKVQVTTAEVHFPLVDVESNKNGIVIRMNDESHYPTANDTVYWDDTGLTQQTNQKASNPNTNIKEGVKSSINGHIWGTTLTTVSTNTGGAENAEANHYGQNRLIDTWAFVKSNALGASSTCVAIYGNVYHDNNGNTNIDPSGSGQIPSGLYATLVSGSNVLQSVPVQPDGSYVFDGGPGSPSGLGNGTYTVVLSTTQATTGGSVPSATLPAGWSHVGQDCCDNTGNDGNNDGRLTVTIVGVSVNNANFGINASPVTVSGTVFNDYNGNAVINAAPEAGTNGGSTALTAYLVDADGKVISSTSVAANGTYTLSGAMPSVSYTVVVSNTAGVQPGDPAPAPSLPGNFVNTGEAFGNNNAAGTGTETGTGNIIPGSIAVRPNGSGNVTGVNFGINEPPTAVGNTLPAQNNPGGTVSVDVTTGFSGSDAGSGTVVSLTVTAFPSNATSITIGITTYYANAGDLPAGCSNCAVFPANGITVPTNGSGQPTAGNGIKVDPVNGAVTVAIPFMVTDNAGLVSKEDMVEVPFLPENTTFAVNDENSTWVNTPVSGNVVTNDFDLEGNAQNFGSFLNPGETGNIASGSTVPGKDVNGNPVANAGTLTFNNTGNYTFNPAPGFTGNISVPYNICDNGSPVACDTAYLDITVSSLPVQNNSVIANNDEYFSFGTPVTGNITTNDTDPQQDHFTVTTYRYDSNGDGIPDATGTLSAPRTVGGVNEYGQPVTNAGTLTQHADGTFSFVPVPGFAGEVKISYTICDDFIQVACDEAVVTITVLKDNNGALNDPPFAGDDFSYTMVNTPVNGNFTSNDTDLNGDPISVNGITIIPGGPATLVQTLATAQGGSVELYANGTYKYTPPADYSGPDRVIYEICDVTVVAPQPLCARATIHMLIPENISISGKVWHDHDGSMTLNTGETNTTADSVLFVTVLNSQGRVIATAQVEPDGTYEVDGVPALGDYTIRLSSVPGKIDSLFTDMRLPHDWVYTGQNYDGTIISGTPGTIAFSPRGKDVVNLDFGIEVIPEAYAHLVPTFDYYPDIDSIIPVLPEYFKTADRDGSVEDIRLTVFPENVRTISIDNVLYNKGNWPEAGITIELDGEGNPLASIWVTPEELYTDIVIPFAPVDNARREGYPATVTLNFNSILPVELLYFSAQQAECRVLLSWATASELNNAYFTISRSTDFVNWEQVGMVSGAGTTGIRQQYSYTDAPEYNGILYYRLAQTDYDGIMEIFPLTAVDITACGHAGVRVYPVPAENIVYVEHSTFSADEQITVTDVTGRVVKQELIGASVTGIDLSILPAGTYYLQVSAPDKIVATHKIVITR